MIKPVVFLLLAILLCARDTVRADSFNVRVDTSTISGVEGLLNFQFLPGNVDAPAAAASVSSFSATDAMLGGAATAGDVTGALPGAVTIRNTFQLNEVAQDFVYGDEISFDVSLTGLTGGASGSEFSLYLFALGQTPDEFASLLTTDVDGRLLSIILDADGNSSFETFGINGSTISVTPAAVPEPAAILLLGTGLAASVLNRMRKSS